jgi:hypothetical protein
VLELSENYPVKSSNLTISGAKLAAALSLFPAPFAWLIHLQVAPFYWGISGFWKPKIRGNLIYLYLSLEHIPITFSHKKKSFMLPCSRR